MSSSAVWRSRSLILLVLPAGDEPSNEVRGDDSGASGVLVEQLTGEMMVGSSSSSEDITSSNSAAPEGEE